MEPCLHLEALRPTQLPLLPPSALGPHPCCRARSVAGVGGDVGPGRGRSRAFAQSPIWATTGLLPGTLSCGQRLWWGPTGLPLFQLEGSREDGG